MPATVASRQARRYRSAFVPVAIALHTMGIAGSAHSADPGGATDRATTATPIKHVIVVIGENQSFDHVYGNYIPPSGDSISNLLSKGRPPGRLARAAFRQSQAVHELGPNQVFHLGRHEVQDPLHDAAGTDPE